MREDPGRESSMLKGPERGQHGRSDGRMNRNWFWRVLNVTKLMQKQRERPSEPDWAVGELRLPHQAAVWVKQKPELKWNRAVMYARQV